MEDVQAGMTLQWDLLAENGSVLLAEGYEFDSDMINRLRKLERQMQESFKVYVKFSSDSHEHG